MKATARLYAGPESAVHRSVDQGRQSNERSILTSTANLKAATSESLAWSLFNAQAGRLLLQSQLYVAIPEPAGVRRHLRH